MRWSHVEKQSSKASAPPYEFWWKHKCVRSSHRQGCSPHSSVQEPVKIPDLSLPRYFASKAVEGHQTHEIAVFDRLCKEEKSRRTYEEPSLMESL